MLRRRLGPCSGIWKNCHLEAEFFCGARCRTGGGRLETQSMGLNCVRGYRERIKERGLREGRERDSCTRHEVQEQRHVLCALLVGIVRAACLLRILQRRFLDYHQASSQKRSHNACQRQQDFMNDHNHVQLQFLILARLTVTELGPVSIKLDMVVLPMG